MKNELTQEDTHMAIMNPRMGDRFHEFFHHWIYVVKVTPKYVWTMSASAPCSFPEDAKLEKRRHEEFRKHCAYGGISGYWVYLCDRGNDVSGWLDAERK